jgi:hypothetical protein
MTSKPSRPVRPIGRVRIGTPLLLGVVVAVTVPVTLAYGAAGGFSRFDEHQLPGTVSLAGPITSVEITGLDESVRVTGSTTAAMVTGTSLVEYHEAATQPQLQETVVDGVAELTWTCPGTHCSGAVSWNITVPAGVPVTAATTNASVYLTSLTGTLTANSSNGDIIGHHLGSGDATFTTSNAGITAQFDGAPKLISATTDNAGVEIDTDGRTSAYDDVRTENSGTDLTNPGNDIPQTDHVIRVRTRNASVNIH